MLIIIMPRRGAGTCFALDLFLLGASARIFCPRDLEAGKIFSSPTRSSLGLGLFVGPTSESLGRDGGRGDTLSILCQSFTSVSKFFFDPPDFGVTQPRSRN
jgi:hypothetical protein